MSDTDMEEAPGPNSEEGGTSQPPQSRDSSVGTKKRKLISVGPVNGEDPLCTDSADSNDVIIIRATDDREIFSNPRNLTALISESPFRKMIIEGSCRVLGKGAAIRFEIKSLNNLSTSLDKIESLSSKTLGPFPVRCWVPRSSTHEAQKLHYGKFGPVDVELTPEEIRKEIYLFDHTSSEIIEVTRLKTFSQIEGCLIPTPTIRVVARGPLPSRIGLFHTSYRVNPYIFDVFRCFNCWRFGHGKLTCRKHICCANCSGAHSSEGCTNPPRCLFCNGQHRVTSKNCERFQEALRLTKIYAGSAPDSSSPLIAALKELNPRAAEGSPTHSRVPAGGVVSPPSGVGPPIATYNKYASLTDFSEG